MVVVCIRVGWGLDLRIGVYFFVFGNKDYYYSKKKIYQVIWIRTIRQAIKESLNDMNQEKNQGCKPHDPGNNAFQANQDNCLMKSGLHNHSKQNEYPKSRARV